MTPRGCDECRVLVGGAAYARSYSAIPRGRREVESTYARGSRARRRAGLPRTGCLVPRHEPCSQIYGLHRGGISNGCPSLAVHKCVGPVDPPKRSRR